MSILEWAAKMQSPAVTPQTLGDWFNKKRDDFRPEQRIQVLVAKAEELIERQDFEDAAAVLSDAMALSPADCSLLANRSYCYEMMSEWDKSLADAQLAIDISEKAVEKLKANKPIAKDPKEPDNSEADPFKYRTKLMYYRKARALRQKKLFQEAIDALVISKQLVIECQFIDDEILDIKLEVICDLGYERSDVEEVSHLFDSLDKLTAHLIDNKKLMISDPNCYQLPSNPFGYHGLYINGLSPDLEEKELEQLMASCGEVVRCKVYSNREQSRAIIIFAEDLESTQSVRKAVHLIHSRKDLIRDECSDNLIVRYRHTCIEGGTDLRSDPQKNFKGTIIGGECYKWRTTGCDDSQCPGLHIPICRHLDNSSVDTADISKRKRRTIVFDLDAQTPVTPITPMTPITPSDPRLGRKAIKFDTNGNSSDTPLCLAVASTPKVRLNESLDSETPKMERKVIRLSKSTTNGVNTDTDSAKEVTETSDKKSQRKRIVFDLNSDDESTDSPKQSSRFTGIKPLPTAAPKPLANDRITSYDDLFD